MSLTLLALPFLQEVERTGFSPPDWVGWLFVVLALGLALGLYLWGRTRSRP